MEELTLDHNTLHLKSTGETAFVTLSNTGPSRYAIKLLCDNNFHYMFNPVHAFLEANSHLEIEVIRSNGPYNESKMDIAFFKATDHDFDPEILIPHGSDGEFKWRVHLIADGSEREMLIPTKEPASP